MKNEKLGSGAAFPMMYDNPGCRGMSKRFYAACAAMQGMLANPNIKRPHPQDGDLNEQLRQFVSIAYEYADKLLTQENE